MNIAHATITGVSAYSQSRFHDSPKIGKETADDHERRTWKNRLHVGSDGLVFMPPMSIKKALEGASSYLGKIPGQRNATYTKRFKSGILVTEQIALFDAAGKPASPDSFEGEWLHLNADGVSGSGKRVKRCMPRIPQWSAQITVHVADEVISEDVMRAALREAGALVGVGRFRPAQGGYYGRFAVTSFSWE